MSHKKGGKQGKTFRTRRTSEANSKVNEWLLFFRVESKHGNGENFMRLGRPTTTGRRSLHRTFHSAVEGRMGLRLCLPDPIRMVPALLIRGGESRMRKKLTRWSFVCRQYRIRLMSGKACQKASPNRMSRISYLALASLTRMRGRARSSRRRALCSIRRRSFSSDIDCLCGRFMVATVSFLWRRNS